MISVQPWDYDPLQLFHVGTHDVATRSPRLIRRDFRALGRMLKDSGAQCFPQSSQQWGETLEETGAPKTSIPGSRTDASTSTLFFITTGESSKHKVCWGLMGSTCPDGGNASLLVNWQDSSRRL